MPSAVKVTPPKRTSQLDNQAITAAKRPRTTSNTSKARSGKGASGKEKSLPVILVTGFLGAGKTTLLSRILQKQQKLRAAVFVNEFGAADVDGQLLRLHSKESYHKVFTLRDGCMCCGGKDDLRLVISEELGSLRGELDVLIIETSGVTDPVPVLATLAAAEGVYIDSVVCVFDATTAKNHSFGAGSDAQRQVSAANVLVLSKVDLLTSAEATEAECKLLALHSTSVEPEDKVKKAAEPKVIHAAHGEVDLEELCTLPLSKRHAPLAQRTCAVPQEVSDTTHTHTDFAKHSYCVPYHALHRDRFEAWAASLPKAILRAKGLVHVKGESSCMVWHWAAGRSSGLHAVPGSKAPLGSEFVFIGKYGEGWAPLEFERSLDQCVAR